MKIEVKINSEDIKDINFFDLEELLYSLNYPNQIEFTRRAKIRIMDLIIESITKVDA